MQQTKHVHAAVGGYYHTRCCRTQWDQFRAHVVCSLAGLEPAAVLANWAANSNLEKHLMCKNTKYHQKQTGTSFLEQQNHEHSNTFGFSHLELRNSNPFDFVLIYYMYRTQYCAHIRKWNTGFNSDLNDFVLHAQLRLTMLHPIPKNQLCRPTCTILSGDV